MSTPKLSDVLAGIADPRLEGAACAGMAPMFDGGGNEAEARAVCRRCPIQTACAAVIAETPKTRRFGIWAGHNYGTGGRT